MARALDALAAPGRVREAVTGPERPALERAAGAQAEVAGAGSAVAVHDADPLADVAVTWAAWFDGEGPAGALEVATAAVLAAWRTRAVELQNHVSSALRNLALRDRTALAIHFIRR